MGSNFEKVTQIFELKRLGGGLLYYFSKMGSNFEKVIQIIIWTKEAWRSPYPKPKDQELTSLFICLHLNDAMNRLYIDKYC